MNKRNNTMEPQVRKKDLVQHWTDNSKSHALCCIQTVVIYNLSIRFLMAKMNRSSPRRDRREACDVEFSEPVYENVKVSVPPS